MCSCRWGLHPSRLMVSSSSDSAPICYGVFRATSKLCSHLTWLLKFAFASFCIRKVTHTLTAIACCRTTKDMERIFCESCGHNTLRKVPYVLNEAGQPVLLGNPNKLPSLRGTKVQVSLLCDGGGYCCSCVCVCVCVCVCERERERERERGERESQRCGGGGLP